MKAALESGRWIGLAPLGYENVRTRIKGEPNIRPVEPAAALVLVRESFESMAAANDRPAALLRKMTASGLRFKKGHRLTLDRFLNALKSPADIDKIPSKKYGLQTEYTSRWSVMLRFATLNWHSGAKGLLRTYTAQ
jgi:hypothetical protein